ncbi:GNAT family N-acetyltransferase [Taibaiella lutea]|uniref:GNAT family N-acetyltransferase n=1 Tax=Taibaiella lutea TaxID=2608001 RepID=A0A5M6CN31_9BACT|nr:GNAT family N-acetyltransferase [Taibaiella lutea]KAA5536628.1 GNAT family N-acetyltransferase [Taibaiella lutea]
MPWKYKSFESLDTIELYKILQLRAEVFIVEQTCYYQDVDNKDLKAIHLWHEDENGTINAYCRLLPAGISYKEPSIGRVATAIQNRKEGLGRMMMQLAIEFIKESFQSDAIRISAQEYLQVFYESLGFKKNGDVYDEDGIPHIEMLLDAN